MKERDKDRQSIMKNVRQVVLKPLPEPYDELPKQPIFKANDPDPIVAFAERFTESGGHFMYCESLKTFLLEVMELSNTKQWKYVYCWEKMLYDKWFDLQFAECKIGEQLFKISAGVCFCEGIVSATGSIILSERNSGALKMLAEAEALIVLARSSQIFPTLNHAISWMKQEQFNNPIGHWISVNGSNAPHPLYGTESNQLKAKEIYLFLVE